MFKSKMLYLVLLAIIFLCATGYSSTADIQREIIVMFKPGVITLPPGVISAPLDSTTIDPTTVRTALTHFNPELIIKGFPGHDPGDTTAVTPDGQVIKKLNLSLIYKIRLPAGVNRDSLIASLDTLPQVSYAEPNGTAEFYSPVFPNDQYFGNQWGLYNSGQSGGVPGADIKAPDAWEIFQGSSSIKIGIIDVGVYASHEDLSGKVTGDPQTDPHGTHVAGIASAKTNNSTGVAGTDWNAQIISKNIDGADLTGIYNKVVEAVNSGSNVLNNSWGLNNGYSVTVRSAFAYAYKMNRTAIASMGNDGGAVAIYPAAFWQGMVAVGATKDNDELAWYSNTGNHIDVVAPGGINPYPDNNFHDIYSCWYGGSQYRYLAGTSMSAPFVTGLASLLKGYKSTLYNDDIEHIIRISADTVQGMGGQEWTPEYGDGRINARKALEYLQFPYSLVQLNVPQGYDQGYQNINMQFYDTPGLGWGESFSAQRHEIRQSVDFIHPFVSPPYVWGRGAAGTTAGYSPENPNFGMGYCDVVPGTVTTTGCNLYTYAYYRPSNGTWFPCNFVGINFFYTLLGEYRLYADEIPSAQSSSPYISVSWNDAYTNEGGYKLERKDATYNQWAIIRTSGPDTTTFQDNNLTGSETYTYKVRGYNGTKNGTYSNEKVIKARPSPPSDFEAMVECVVYGPKGCQTRSNTVFLFWSPPGNQKLPISFYKIKIQEWGGPTTYHGPVYGLEDTLCLSTNKNYYLYVYSVDSEGDSSNYTPAVHVMTGSWDDCSGPLNKPTVQIPQQFYLGQNYPNPFNLSTTIEYGLPQDAHVKLTVYNILGENVRVLVNEYQSAGERNVIWDGKNDNGDVVASGIYLYRIEAGSFTKTAKMSLLK